MNTTTHLKEDRMSTEQHGGDDSATSALRHKRRLKVINWIRAGRVIRGILLEVRDHKGTGEGAVLLDCEDERVLVRIGVPYPIAYEMFVGVPGALPEGMAYLLELRGTQGFGLTPVPVGVATMDAQPSTCTDRFWITARAPGSAVSRDAGKWLVFVSRARVDAWWERIRRAVRAGELGPSAKVSTCRPTPNAKGGTDHVICVYVRNAHDELEVDRVRDALRSLGVDWPIPFKTDDQTRSGRYAGRGLPKLLRK